MSDEAKLLQRSARAERAKALLEDELFVEAVNATRARVYKDFYTVPATDDEGLKTARLKYEVINMILAHFAEYMNDGVMANRDLMELKEEKSRLRMN